MLTGGTKYVHEKCLLKWIDTTPRKDKFHCQICKTKLVHYNTSVLNVS